ncbi:MAG: radical SAM protein [Ruminiclostridium sp.]
MNRKVLLIEPNYKNKYPPMGLMKLATYYRRLEDDVRFFKGNLKEFAARLLCEEFFDEVADASLGKHFPKLIKHIKTGKFAPLEAIPDFRNSELERKIKVYRLRYKAEDFPKFDVVGITTLFTFYWSETVDTINFAKKFCKHGGRMLVGGIASTILPDEIKKETGIDPHIGLLNMPGILDDDNEDVIDELPLDYSILDEIDYKYSANNAYFGYMTRGCVNKCEFCAVPRLEPDYKDYIGLKQQIKQTEERFGAQKDLLLMDNNVFASKCFDKIIDEIKECGFAKDAMYIPPSEYSIVIDNLKAEYNVRAYKKKMIGIYDCLSEKMSEEDAGDFYRKREKLNLLYAEAAISLLLMIQFAQCIIKLLEN